MLRNIAFDWIVGVLKSNDIPYVICGGLAAIAYGAARPLNDIDIFVPKERYMDLVRIGRECITFGPERYQDSFWNVDYVQFSVEGTKVEIGNSEGAEIYNLTEKSWTSLVVDYERYTVISVLGHDVRVMNKDDLIEYKRKLARKVDLIDIACIKARNSCC